MTPTVAEAVLCRPRTPGGVDDRSRRVCPACHDAGDGVSGPAGVCTHTAAAGAAVHGSGHLVSQRLQLLHNHVLHGRGRGCRSRLHERVVPLLGIGW
jgi:hypothetical protein